MNAAQRLVLLLAVILLGFVFVFPLTSYPVLERSADGLTSRSTVKTGVMPFWHVRDKSSLNANPFSDTTILWHWVLLIAAGITLLCGWWIYRLRSLATPVPSTTPPTAGTESGEMIGLKAKLLSCIGHGLAVMLIYLAIKHFARGGLTQQDLWVAPILAVFVGVLSSFPWRLKAKPVVEDS